MIFRIINLRDYAKTYSIFKDDQKEQDMSKRAQGPAIEVVRGIFWEIQKERLAATSK